MTAPLYALSDVDAFYGKAQVLHRVSLEIYSGRVLALVGRNGAGKSTMLKTLAGLVACTSGTRVLDGLDVTDRSVEDLARLGVTYVPENRQIFPTLTVEENLLMGRVVKSRQEGAAWTLEDVWSLFPPLYERRRARGQTLSGGEQQMLAIARAIMCNARVMLLDEPTEGLAPRIVESVISAIRQIMLSKVGMVLVEQNLRVPLKVADMFLIIDKGAVAWSGNRAALERDLQIVERLVSV